MKKGIAVLVLTALSAGFLFAQEEETAAAPEKPPAMNSITVDFGPTIFGVGAGALLGALVPGISGRGFGIGAQYERQIIPLLSVAGRFEYLGMGLGLEFSGLKADIDVSSYSAEGHVRLYPFRGTFFLDGALGYTYFGLTATVASGGVDQTATLDATAHYFKTGAKLGWRIHFGKRGGFVFEPAFGYFWGLGGKVDPKVTTGMGDDLDAAIADILGSDSTFNTAIGMFSDYVFVGGPKMSLSFGWMF